MPTASLELGPSGSANPRLTTLLGELEVARRFTLSIVRDLSAGDLAAVPRGSTNTIGSILSHIAAAEGVMRRVTNGEPAFPPGSEAEQRVFGFQVDPLAGSELSAYVEHLEATRRATRDRFAERDDVWLDTPRSFLKNPANYHYYWFHLILDEARHQGQIVLLRKYLIEGADAEFDPYMGLAADTAAD
jgi:uncharacterized damage-inducible protein DinB